MVGVPRLLHQQAIHFLRKTILFSDGNVLKTIGTIPAGSLILTPLSGVVVTTVFNAGTNNLINMGFVNASTSTANYYGTVMSLLALGLIPFDEAVTMLVAVDTDITATLALSGTAATTGALEAIVAYIPDIDG